MLQEVFMSAPSEGHNPYMVRLVNSVRYTTSPSANLMALHVYHFSKCTTNKELGPISSSLSMLVIADYGKGYIPCSSIVWVLAPNHVIRPVGRQWLKRDTLVV